MARRRKKRLPSEPVEAQIESLAHDGRGVTHVDDKVVFVHGALAGERLMFQYTRRTRKQDEGRAVEVLEPSADRVEPRCAHFGVCGGCSLQHMDPAAQIRSKQTVLLENLKRIGDVVPETVLEPLTGPLWGYRRKARLGVKYVPKKDKVLVGFRERGAPFVAELSRCDVLHPSVGERLESLGSLIYGMEARASIPQIEVAVGDNATSLVFRHMEPLSDADRDKLVDYARREGLQILLQPKGPETIHPLWPEEQDLYYRLPDHDVAIHFKPNDFTQVNAEINQKMVNQALELLAPQEDERILDLFAGLGNFSLPLARHAREVVGIEGDQMMVARGRESAERNGIGNTAHYACDLFQPSGDEPWMRGGYDKVLLDPPRAGAIEVLPAVAEMGPGRIVYVSCHPATLARDAGELVHRFGYRLTHAGVMDMFPHTSHVESIAVFEK